MVLIRDYTDRGFNVVGFCDTNDEPCSIQKSSVADYDAIWFGANDCKIKHFKPYRQPDPWVDIDIDALLGVTPENKCSWIGTNRMHLSREQVAEILPVLQEFVKTGNVQ